MTFKKPLIILHNVGTIREAKPKAILTFYHGLVVPFTVWLAATASEVDREIFQSFISEKFVCLQSWSWNFKILAQKDFQI